MLGGENMVVVIATNNKNKVYEFKSLFGNDNIEFKTLKEIGYDVPITIPKRYRRHIDYLNNADL